MTSLTSVIRRSETDPVLAVHAVVVALSDYPGAIYDTRRLHFAAGGDFPHGPETFRTVQIHRPEDLFRQAAVSRRGRLYFVTPAYSIAYVLYVYVAIATKPGH